MLQRITQKHKGYEWKYKGRIVRPEAEKSRLILPRVGQIKIGMKNANGYPQSVDYFIPTGKYAGLFTQAYGENPKQFKSFSRTTTRRKYVTNVTNTGTTTGD